MRWALKGGILAERSLVAIDRLPAMRMNGPHPHHVAVADAGHGGDADHLTRGGGFARRRQAVALAAAGILVVGAERAAQGALDAFRHLGEGDFAVERRKNGAADEGRAAQTGQNGAAKPLHRDAAAIDHRSFRTIH